MADTKKVDPAGPPTEAATPTKPKHVGPRPPSKFNQLNKLYGLPAPIRTFPLPTLIPHNPLSLFHVLYVWLSQTINRPSSHFDTLYHGWFSPETRSIQITDSRSIRGLWEQGFYGKGSLSRSEPSWLTREKKRRGVSKAIASEDVTRKRRAERQQTKWERARKEREAIDQTLLAEAKANESPNINNTVVTGEKVAAQVDNVSLIAEQEIKAEVIEEQLSSSLAGSDITLSSIGTFNAPTGPMQLLALPNSTTAVIKTEIMERESSTYIIDSNEVVFSDVTSFIAPTGPLAILALPNSLAELDLGNQNIKTSRAPSTGSVSDLILSSAPVGPMELLALPNCATDALTTHDTLNLVIERNEIFEGCVTPPTSVEMDNSSVSAHESNEVAPLARVSIIERDVLRISTPITESVFDVNEAPATADLTIVIQSNGSDGEILENGSSIADRRKSVRFSPTVEQATFLPSQPPTPRRTVASTEEKPDALSELPLNEDMIIEDKEHFQLTMEEAFFLSYGLGALTILDPATTSPISNQDLFTLFRKTSYFPPVSNPGLSTDDPFLVNYVVYHHFRSLGWVVRGGTKFSVDYLLYNRGPVFSHAEFAVLIIPSYSDPYWSSGPFLENYVKGKQGRSWSWMHCINRVITQVKKTLILVYVDIPAPVDGSVKENSVDELLQKYKVREIVLKRWSPNRSRD